MKKLIEVVGVCSGGTKGWKSAGFSKLGMVMAGWHCETLYLPWGITLWSWSPVCGLGAS